MNEREHGVAQSRGELLLYGCFAVLYAALCMHLPVAIYAHASLDDALFIRHGQQIASFHWLGSFNQGTLAKGVFYPIFLALNSWLGIPVTLSMALFYVLAAWLFVRALMLHGLGRWAALIVFIVVLFQPAVFPTRIIRDYVYQSLVLLVLAGVLSIRSEARTARLLNPRLFFFGMAAGAFWLTREEGVWILPGVTVFLAFQFYTLRRSPVDLRAMGFGLLMYGMGALALPAAVSTANWIAYGTFRTIDFKGAHFEKALNRLNGVSIENEVPYVPVSVEKRALIYQVSPSFRQLEDYFERRGKAWTQPGCAHYPSTCGDYAGGWFMWALRDAVADQGEYSSPKRADRFYASVANEIDAACRRGDLTCKESPVPFLPQMPRENLAKLPDALKNAWSVSVYRASVPATDGNSTGNGAVLNDIQRFLGQPLRTPAVEEEVSAFAGWYYASDGGWIELSCQRSGGVVPVDIERHDSPDIAAHVRDPEAVSQRFAFSVKNAENCIIVGSTAPKDGLPVAEVFKARESSMRLGSGTLHFDMRSSNGSHFATALAVKGRLAQLFQWVSGLLVGFAAVCYMGVLMVSAFRRQGQNPLVWIAGALWLLYGVRVALVVLIDISSFPAVNYLYLMPAFPLLYSAAVLSVVLGLQLGKEWARSERDV